MRLQFFFIVIGSPAIPRRRGRGPGIEKIFPHMHASDSQNISGYQKLINRGITIYNNQIIYIRIPNMIYI